MYSLTVRDHIMIAHSFTGEIFGPAQRTHGATYLVDASFQRRSLDDDGLVVDIGRATEALRDVLSPLNYRDLDDELQFAGHNTTTEFLAHAIQQRLTAAIREGRLGRGAVDLDRVAVTLHESHVAWASYDGPVTGDETE